MLRSRDSGALSVKVAGGVGSGEVAGLTGALT